MTGKEKGLFLMVFGLKVSELTRIDDINVRRVQVDALMRGLTAEQLGLVLAMLPAGFGTVNSTSPDPAEEEKRGE
jgi:hypothetical protein